ncbi:DUF4468 domain-containing protein [Mucilaginibacter sp. E4BP6]|uniref:DUF4468 domain-containing protein n=1 Tax=Mucilaginibacter sp. E4BP6 TaxID=2723089 RepID=UPI0015CC6D29|nr:DUF4468 domain-containing protein [Mucilaginibacter sp. E4BP6]NYE67080.1 hypothetical protein [Mucilaginibacter sp. E4BP6]
MKKLLVMALIIFTKSAFAQKDTVGLNIAFTNNTVAYEKIIEVPNASKNMLYSNAALWLAETRPYVADTQLELADPVLSRVVGRVTSSFTESYKVLWQTNYFSHIYNFTVQIDCKDNRYRIRIYNIQDVVGTTYTPIDNLMYALINSKSYTLGNGGVLKVSDLQDRFRTLNTIVQDVTTDISKSMVVDNSF